MRCLLGALNGELVAVLRIVCVLRGRRNVGAAIPRPSEGSGPEHLVWIRSVSSLTGNNQEVDSTFFEYPGRFISSFLYSLSVLSFL